MSAKSESPDNSSVLPADRNAASAYYPDVPLFLALIPVINIFNYYLTYTNIRLNGFLALTFTIDTLQGYAAWLSVRYLILYYDKVLPYGKKPLRRILIQLASTTLLGLLVISLLTELTSWIARSRPADAHFYTRDLVIISVWFFVINGIYIGIYYYNEWQRSEARRREETRLKAEGLMVKLGRQAILLGYDELAGFYVDGDHVLACSINGRKYYIDQSLGQLKEALPASLFFRLNRQFLLHRQMVAGFERAENGKIQVLVRGHNDNFPSRIPVSRTRAPAFKSWFVGKQ
ncbi:MAG: LytTR family transcriptional regulator [Phaeodactylibacter sp.]|nr:LytTR family transcriptional regulator [Phaeodactylibacter sp.]